MIILLSPSKKQSAIPASANHGSTTPAEIKKALFLMGKLKALSISELSDTMKLSESLAKDTHQSIKNFSVDNKNNNLQAIHLFQGDAFQKFNSNSLRKNDLLYSEKHIIILSALYGYLKPLDAVQAYRLNMNDAVKIPPEKSLYHYWKESITAGLNNLLLQQKNNIILNLASNEYFKVIDLKKLTAKVIYVDFKVLKNKEYKTVGMHAKRGRGLLARYIIDNKIDYPEPIVNFEGEGFKYSKSLSTPENYVFILRQ